MGVAMRRLTALTALACLMTLPALAGQTPPPAQKTKYIAPVKDLATIEVIQMPSRKVGKEMVTLVKVRNTSKGSINLLKIDEYWYDASLKIVGGGPYAHKKAPIQPGEIVEIKLSSPWNAQMNRQQLMFRHAYGKVDAKAVKIFK
jgi:hypothetical protein